MTPYDTLIAAGDEEHGRGLFKEASITYGKALAIGGPRDQYCRQMRGISSRLVGEQRLQKASQQPELRQRFLLQAARWLTKAEANLDSALEEAGPSERALIRLEQARTEEALGTLLVMCGGNPHRRQEEAQRFREEGAALLA
ncbi:MAG: hypothetical protein M3Q48_04440 [Actinomycetota bacterium]|nr:hypothetical protein [Actinomycetota bacterium]